MKKRQSFLVMIIALLTLLVSLHAQEYKQWGLPEGAITRLGKGGINAMQFSPDGTRLAVGSDIGVWLYDAQTGTELSLFVGECDALAFSPDGRLLASSGGGLFSGAAIQLWETATGREVPLDAKSAAAALVFHANSNFFTSLDIWGNTIGIWDVATGRGDERYMRARNFGSGPLYSEVFALTRDKFAVGKADGKIELWDATTRGRAAKLKGHLNFLRNLGTLETLGGRAQPPPGSLRNQEAQVLALAFSSNGTTLASGGKDKTVRLWDTTTTPAGFTLLGAHEGWVTVLAFSSDGAVLASGSVDNAVKLWDTATGEARATLTGHINDITAIAFSPDGKTVASASADSTVLFWDTETGERLPNRIDGHTKWVKTAAFSEEGQTLVSVAFNGIITSWDTKSWEKRGMRVTGHRDFLPTAAFSRDGAKLASVGANGKMLYGIRINIGIMAEWRAEHRVRLVEVSTGKELATLRYTRGISHLTFAPNGKTVAFGGLGELCVWDTETGSMSANRLTERRGDIFDVPLFTALAFSPDSTTLLSGTSEGKIRLWDIETGTEFASWNAPVEWDEDMPRMEFDDRILSMQQTPVHPLVFSPDGTLCAGGTSGKIHIWDIGTREAVFTLDATHKHGRTTIVREPEALAFSPDGATLISGGRNGEILMWDVNTGEKLTVHAGHTAAVNTLVFSPDGETLVSTGEDGTVLLWDWEEVELLNR